MSAGKGDKFRKVDKKKFDENYDRVFKKIYRSRRSEEDKREKVILP